MINCRKAIDLPGSLPHRAFADGPFVGPAVHALPRDVNCSQPGLLRLRTAWQLRISVPPCRRAGFQPHTNFESDVMGDLIELLIHGVLNGNDTWWYHAHGPDIGEIVLCDQ